MCFCSLSDCTLKKDSGPGDVQSDGFLIIHDVEVLSGHEVVIKGAPTSFAAMFEKVKFHISKIDQADSSIDRSQSRHLAKVSRGGSFKLESKPPLLILEGSVQITVDAGLRDWFYISGDGVTDMSIDIFFEAQATAKCDLKFGLGKFDSDDRFCRDVVKDIPILVVPIIGWIGSFIPSFKSGIYAGQCYEKIFLSS